MLRGATGRPRVELGEVSARFPPHISSPAGNLRARAPARARARFRAGGGKAWNKSLTLLQLGLVGEGSGNGGFARRPRSQHLRTNIRGIFSLLSYAGRGLRPRGGRDARAPSTYARISEGFFHFFLTHDAGPCTWPSRGYLPHFEQPPLVHSTTLGLFDSLPWALLAKCERRTGDEAVPRKGVRKRWESVAGRKSGGYVR